MRLAWRAAAVHPLFTGDPACLGASLEELAALLRKEQCNSYGIMAPPGPGGERRLRGGGVYPSCSLINHECAPNAARFDAFDAPLGAPSTSIGSGAPSTSNGTGGGGSPGYYPGSTMVAIRAMHDLPAGTEVVQSYFPLNWDLEDRQAQARDVYGFSCRCPRCLTEADPEWQAAAGGSSSGSGWETDSSGGEEEGGSGGMEHDGGDGGPEGLQPLGLGCPPGSDGSEGREPLDPTYLQLFMLKYMCPQESCFGTMAAVLGAAACECNVCGHRRTDEEFLADLERGE
jgi:hypothetical protein